MPPLPHMHQQVSSKGPRDRKLKYVLESSYFAILIKIQDQSLHIVYLSKLLVSWKLSSDKVSMTLVSRHSPQFAFNAEVQSHFCAQESNTSKINLN